MVPPGCEALPYEVANVRGPTKGLERVRLAIAVKILDRSEKLIRSASGLIPPRGRQGQETLIQPPPFSYAVLSSFAMARWVRKHRPDVAFVLEAYPHGLAAALAPDARRVVMPWGADIYQYAEASPLIRWVLGWSLRRAHLVCPAAVTAVPYLQQAFGVDRKRVVAIPWGVDRRLFFSRSRRERQQIRERYQLFGEDVLVLNVRRFAPHWGCREALEVCLRVAGQRGDCRFLFFGGGKDELVEQAKRRVKQAGFGDRFIFFPQLSLEECAEVMAISDVFLSLHRSGDMRSWSIVQAAACGAVPILSDQAEYREMMRDGFSACLVNPDDVEAVAGEINYLIDNVKKREAMRAKNAAYISYYEDSEKQMKKMITEIEKILRY